MDDIDDLFEMLPEGTRIVIKGNQVTFENLTPDMLDVAHALNPQDQMINARRVDADALVHADDVLEHEK